MCADTVEPYLERRWVTMNHTRTALITGASSGIGRELTRLFAGDVFNCCLSAGASHGGLLCYQGLRFIIFRGTCRGTTGYGCMRNCPMPRSDGFWFSEPGEDGRFKAGERQEADECSDGCACWISWIDAEQNGSRAGPGEQDVYFSGETCAKKHCD